MQCNFNKCLETEMGEGGGSCTQSATFFTNDNLENILTTTTPYITPNILTTSTPHITPNILTQPPLHTLPLTLISLLLKEM